MTWGDYAATIRGRQKAEAVSLNQTRILSSFIIAAQTGKVTPLRDIFSIPLLDEDVPEVDTEGIMNFAAKMKNKLRHD